MISIQPQHAYNIIVGKKTLELRTWIPKDYVGWVYVYVCKTIRNYKLSYYYQPKNQEKIYRLHGNIPFRFWFDEYETIPYEVTLPRGYESSDGEWIDHSLYGYWTNAKLLEQSCLTDEEISIYGKGKDLYAWHIKKLEIFDEPKYLNDFESRTPYKNNDGRVVAWGHRPIIKPPQKMQWVYKGGKKMKEYFIYDDKVYESEEDVDEAIVEKIGHNYNNMDATQTSEFQYEVQNIETVTVDEVVARIKEKNNENKKEKENEIKKRISR